MVEQFVKAWDKNSNKLKEYIKTHIQSDYCNSYEQLVKLLFNIVINPEVDQCCDNIFDIDNMTVVDDGDYQGTLIFILHKEYYEPDVGDYVYTSVSYGSCSGCDTLQGIHQYDDDQLPSDTQVEDYMLLLLHLLQNCHYMKEG